MIVAFFDATKYSAPPAVVNPVTRFAGIRAIFQLRSPKPIKFKNVSAFFGDHDWQSVISANDCWQRWREYHSTHDADKLSPVHVLLIWKGPRKWANELIAAPPNVRPCVTTVVCRVVANVTLINVRPFTEACMVRPLVMTSRL